MSINKSKIFGLIALLVVVSFCFGLFWLIKDHFLKPLSTYEPYTADYLAVILGDKSLPPEKFDNLDFALFEVREKIKEGMARPAIITHNKANQFKNFQLALDLSNDTYIDLFSWRTGDSDGLTNTTTFSNIFELNHPFEIKSYPSRDNVVDVIYDLTSREINFVLRGQVMKVNDDTIQLNDTEIYSLSNVPEESIVTIGDISIDLRLYDNNTAISINSLLAEPVKIYSLSNLNLLSGANASFEGGLWQAEVADCSAYLPGDPQIAMDLSRDASQGEYALRLISSNHYACTFNAFDVTIFDDKIYKIGFDYNSVSGEQVQFYYNLKNSHGQNQDFSQRFQPELPGWNYKSYLVKPTIEDGNALEVYFYAPAEDGNNVITLYDNLNFAEYSLSQTVQIPEYELSSTFGLSNWFNLKNNTNYFEALVNQDNLLKDYNFSFESGLWQEEVTDCSNYLPGSAQLGMLLNGDSTDGNSSLELSSDNHFACTFNEFAVNLKSNTLYRFSFDYRTLAERNVQYYYKLKNDTLQVQEQFDSFEATTDQWQTFSTVINPHIDDVSALEVYFYAPSDGSKKIVNLFDNLKVEEISQKEIYTYYLKALKNNNRLSTTTITEYRQLDSLSTKIVLHNISEPVLLVYPKAYAADFKAYLLPGSALISPNLPLSYNIEQSDADIYATKKDLAEYIAKGILSQTGEKMITKLNKGIIRNENLSDVAFFGSKNKLNDNLHFSVDEGLNGWLIDPAQICAGADKGCIKNNDGTWDLTLLVKEQKLEWFYWALLGIISVVGLLLMIVIAIRVKRSL